MPLSTGNSGNNTVTTWQKSRMKFQSKPKVEEQDIEAKRSDAMNGLSRRQRTFILEKLVGLNDKEAALAAGYSLSVSENTKQKVWKPEVHAEFERLKNQLRRSLRLKP